MKTRKIVAVLLSMSLLAGTMTGCSKVKKVSLKSMQKAATKAEAEIVEDIDDFEDVDDDDLEDGVLYVIDNDSIEDAIDELDIDEDKLDDAVDLVNDVLDTDIEFDINEINEIAVYERADDGNIMAVIYADIGNKDVAGQLFSGILNTQDDINDEIDDLIDNLDDIDYYEDFEFNLENLSDDEFYFNGRDKGYLRLCITNDNIDDILDDDIPAILDDMDLGMIGNYLDTILDEISDEFPYDVIAFGLYFNGSSIVVSLVASDDDDFTADFDAYLKSIGLDTPTEVELSDYAKKLLLLAVVPAVSQYGAAGAGLYSSYVNDDFNMSSIIEEMQREN